MKKRYLNLFITLSSLIAIVINIIFFNSNPYVSLVIAVILMFNLFFTLPSRNKKFTSDEGKEEQTNFEG